MNDVPPVDFWIYQKPFDGQKTEKSVLPSPSKSARTVPVGALAVIVKLTLLMSKKIFPTGWILIRVVVGLFGTVIDCVPSFGVLARIVIGKFSDKISDSVKNQQIEGSYEFASFRLDVKQRRVFCRNEPISLTPKEFDVLFLLIENAGKVVEKDELLEKIWKDTFVEEGTLTRNISWLRKKLAAHNSSIPKIIETLPKRGYLFLPKVRKGDESVLFIEEQTIQHIQIEEVLEIFPSSIENEISISDGKTIVYSKGSGKAGLWSVGINGEDEKPISELAEVGVWRSWFVASNGVYFTAFDTQPPFRINFFDFPTRQTKEITKVEKSPLLYYSNLSVTADGKKMLYARQDQSAKHHFVC